MKKSLYLSTALAAASVLAFGSADANAKKIKIGLGGFLTSYIGYAEQDGSFESTADATTRVGYDSINIITDTEVYFKGGTKLDNGVGVNVVIQLEGDAVSGGAVDETYVKLTGGFGDVRLGATKAAGSVLKHNAPNSGLLSFNGGDVENWIVQPAGSSLSSSQGTNIGGSDALKMVYITPKINGFRIGATYVPSTTTADTMPATGGTDGTETQVYDIMASYEQKLGGANLEADVGMWREQGTAANSIDGRRFGVNIGFGAITIGGSILNEDAVDSGQSILATNPDVEAMDIGISYEMSSSTSASLTFMNAQKDNASGTAGEDSVTKLGLGLEHSMGSGVDFVATIAQVDWEDETTDDANNNDGWLAVAGISVGF
ncbi:MAG: porin [Rhodospirillales bacterium]